MTDCKNEQCWWLTGTVGEHFWVAKASRETEGQPASVGFDHAGVLLREEIDGDVIGFFHTHPSFSSTPSLTDYRTMQAWSDCFGKEMLCLIDGVDGLKAYWFFPSADDDGHYCEECLVEKVGDTYVGWVDENGWVEVFDNFDDELQNVVPQDSLPGEWLPIPPCNGQESTR